MASVTSTGIVENYDYGLNPSIAPNSLLARTQQTTTPLSPSERAQISPAGKLRSSIASLEDAAALLARADAWSATQTFSSDNTTVSALSAVGARNGQYRVSVDAMATAQTVTSANFSSLSTVIGLGSLSIQLGNWNTAQSTFATNPNWPKASVMMGPRDDSIERVRDKINAAGVGVVAAVISDATGSRLVLRSTASGQSNGFKVEVSPPAAESTLGFQITQNAQDAKLSINGKSMTSPSNVIDLPTEGLQLTLKQPSSEPVMIQVSADTAGMSQNVRDFAGAYNDLAEQVAKSDTDSGILQSARALQKSLLTQLSDKRTNAMGLSLSDEGLLNLDEALLKQSFESDRTPLYSLSSLASRVLPQSSVISNADGASRQGLDALYAAEKST